MTIRVPNVGCFALGVALIAAGHEPIAAVQNQVAGSPRTAVTIDVDASDAPMRILHATMSIPENASFFRVVRLDYPGGLRYPHFERIPGTRHVLTTTAAARTALAQGGAPPDQPAVTVRGQTYTPRSILSRNMGTDEDQTTAFPPHKVIGNIYYVGTRTLSSYLIATPQGHILLNSTYERNVRTIEKSVTQLGFKFADVRVLLGTHAHGDHQEGDGLLKELTGAQVLAMAEDVPALEAIRPGGKAHPIDRTLHDGEEVTLGGTTLVAHLTAGHTRGCTTWTMKAQEGGKSFSVVFACSYRAPGTVTPAIENEFNRTFKIIRSLPCDVPLGDHPAQYNMVAKHARLKAGAPNPFIDAANCWLEADIQEAMLRAQAQTQQKAVRDQP